MECSPPGSSVHGIIPARILEWVAISISGDLPDPGIEPTSPVAPALQGHSSSAEPLGKPSFPLAVGHAVTSPVVASPGMVTAWTSGTVGY